MLQACAGSCRDLVRGFSSALPRPAALRAGAAAGGAYTWHNGRPQARPCRGLAPPSLALVAELSTMFPVVMKTLAPPQSSLDSSEIVDTPNVNACTQHTTNPPPRVWEVRAFLPTPFRGRPAVSTAGLLSELTSRRGKPEMRRGAHDGPCVTVPAL